MATTPNSLPSAFDAQHPPAADIVDKCVHCGFCLPVCPTYLLWGQEMDSPRGRIYLVKLAGEGAAEINSKWVSHFDSCLGCMACMTACPSGVDYGKLIEATRAQIERNFTRPSGEKRHRHFLFETFTRPDRLDRLRAPLLAYQKSGLQALARGLGLVRLLPKKWRTMEALLPRLTAGVTYASGSGFGSHACRRHETPARRPASRLRAARIFLAGQCRHGTRPRSRGLRGGRSTNASLLWGLACACGRRGCCHRPRQEDDGCLRAGQR